MIETDRTYLMLFQNVSLNLLHKLFMSINDKY